MTLKIKLKTQNGDYNLDNASEDDIKKIIDFLKKEQLVDDGEYCNCGYCS